MYKLNKKEDGFASIIIALILIIVLSLLTVGFAQLARREQQTALDKQLSNQAFYAAESGVNSAYQEIKIGPPNGISSTTTGVNQGSCLLPTAFPDHGVISSTNAITYPCVIVNLTPPTLSKTMNAGESWSTIFTTSSAADGTADNLSGLTVSWSSFDGDNTTAPTFTSGNSLETQAAWTAAKQPAVLQVTLTAIPDPNNVTRTSLMNDSYTYYLYPGSGCSGAAGQGQFLCSGAAAATAPFFNVPLPVNIASSTFLVHIVDYYDQSTIQLGSAVDSANKTLDFDGSQAIIDSTGKAQDVLRRIQVVTPLQNEAVIPGFAIEAQDLCKELSTQPGTTGTTFASPYPDANTCNPDD